MTLALVHAFGLLLIAYVAISGQRRVMRAMEKILHRQDRDYEQDYVIREMVTRMALRQPGPLVGSPRQRREPRHIREIPRSEG